ncbi:MAG: glycoside hydrolase family 15 protein [Burkholderiales bacterium]|nr:glycoside hydrolase family 15 protein [Burkholderiales bacterium]
MAVGSNTALLVSGDIALQPAGEHDLAADFEMPTGARLYLAVQVLRPEAIDEARARLRDRESVDSHLRETLEWWRNWSSKLQVPSGPHGLAGEHGASLRRSAITLKALTFAPTGAIIAAPTTSLPEDPGGVRNWDYRYSWVRDSVFTVRALGALGCAAEADGFRRFIQRSAAGNAKELRVMIAVDGKRRLPELPLGHLEGWRGSRPVRIGNAAGTQYQADIWGLLLELAWRASERGVAPGPDEWAFLAEAAGCAARQWQEPDQGIWEIRDAPRHFVHSKVMCWAALDRALRLAERHALPAPLPRWRGAREAIGAAVLAEGVARGGGHGRGGHRSHRNHEGPPHFVASFGSRDIDAALLLLPESGFVGWRDPLMLATTDAIVRELDSGGLIQRYRTPDGIVGDEGAFVACTFWLAEGLARQGRLELARHYHANACRCANDLGLFAEQFDPARRELLGNFPQGLSHLAHLSAALALGSLDAVAELAAAS